MCALGRHGDHIALPVCYTYLEYLSDRLDRGLHNLEVKRTYAQCPTAAFKQFVDVSFRLVRQEGGARGARLGITVIAQGAVRRRVA